MKKRKAKLIEIFNDPSEKYATSLMDKKSLKAAEVSICRDLTEKNQDGNKMKFDLKIARKESGELTVNFSQFESTNHSVATLKFCREGFTNYKNNKRTVLTILN